MEKDSARAFASVVEKVIPDTITSAVGMVLLLFLFATIIGVPLAKTVEAYYKGLWMLLTFTMQMTLIITLSAVVGASPIFKRLIKALSKLPSSQYQVVVLAVLVTLALAYL